MTSNNDYKQNLTLVTCLFDLKIRKWKSRGMDFYFQHGLSILTLNQNLIIFCDPHLVGKIWSIRLQHGLITKTSIISLPLESIKYYQKLKVGRNKKDTDSLQDER